MTSVSNFQSKNHEYKCLKLILILGILLISSMSYYVYFTSYKFETSFYNNLEYLPVFVLLIGISFLLFNKYDKLIKNSKFIYISCIYYFLYTILIFSQLWVIKYGQPYGVDWWLHLSSIDFTLNKSIVDLNFNFYPSFSIFISEISLVTSFEPKFVLTFISFFTILSFGLMSVTLLKFLSTKTLSTLPIGTFFLILAISPIVLSETGEAPWTFNFTLISMYMYFFGKNSEKNFGKYMLLLILCIIAITITHLIGTIYIAICSLLICISIYISKKVKTRLTIKSFIDKQYILLIFVILFFWIFLLSGFSLHQLSYVLLKLPSVIFGEHTATQVMVSRKSNQSLLISRVNIIVNVIFVFISFLLILQEILSDKNSSKRDTTDNKLNNLNYLYIFFVISGAILYFVSQFFLGSTLYNGTQIRYLMYSAIIFPIFISYVYAKLNKPLSQRLLSYILVFILIISVANIYPQTEFNDLSLLNTESTTSGLDWGNTNVISENNSVITGADFISQYIGYKTGPKMYPSMYGSTNGLMIYFNIDYQEYQHRQSEENFSIKPSNKVYIYYYPLMKYSIAFSKNNYSSVGLEPNNIATKKVDKIYNSDGFTIFKLTESEKKNLLSLL